MPRIEQDSFERSRFAKKVRTEAGLTLVEVSIVSVVITIMSVAIAQSLRSLSQAHNSMVAQSRVSSITDRVTSMIAQDISDSIRMLEESPLAWELFQRLDRSPAFATPLSGSRCATATSSGTFSPDSAGLTLTGNVLLTFRRFGHELGVVTTGSGPQDLRVDIFRIVAWYLTEGTETGVDLNRWCSVKLARMQDIQSLGDPDQRLQFGLSLYDQGTRYAWDPLSPSPVEGFFEIRTDGSLHRLDASRKVPMDDTESTDKFFGRRFCGVAANETPTAQVPKFTTATASFPHGFEIKRDGDGSGDLVLFRLVTATRAGRHRYVTTYEATRQLSFREE